MNGLAITVTLGAAVFAGTVLAPRLRMATPLLLLLMGLALGFVPELRHIDRFEDLDGGAPVPPAGVLLDVGDSLATETG